MISALQTLIKICRAMGWCWCCPKKRPDDGYDLDPFLSKRLPIFWVMGPPGCGKTTIATRLANCSGFRLISISELIQKEIAKGKWNATVISSCMKAGGGCPNDILLKLLKETFIATCHDSIGYILDGFPLDLQQAKEFELEICKVQIIIYPALTVDAFMAKIVDQGGDKDLQALQERHEKSYKMCQETYRHYEEKTLKCITSYSIEITMNELIIDLDRFFGYKFNF